MKSAMRVVTTNRFERDVLLIKKRGKDMSKVQIFLGLLASRSDIPVKYKNHKLKGNFKDRWECHIEPDWLLMYRVKDNIIQLERTGTHADLFK